VGSSVGTYVEIRGGILVKEKMEFACGKRI
jgi:hypothetical protein